MLFLTTVFEANAATVAAATGGSNGGLFAVLGIDWRLLLLQIVAFLLLAWLLGRFVYPWLMKSVDARRADLEAAAHASKEAQERLAEVRQEADAFLAQARKEAGTIVSTAKTEASELLSASETRAKQSTERIAAAAHQQIQKDIQAAKRELYNETLDLVALTTQKVVGSSHDTQADDALISSLLEEHRP